jgi:hypothetical protein
MAARRLNGCEESRVLAVRDWPEAADLDENLAIDQKRSAGHALVEPLRLAAWAENRRVDLFQVDLLEGATDEVGG